MRHALGVTGQLTQGAPLMRGAGRRSMVAHQASRDSANQNPTMKCESAPSKRIRHKLYSLHELIVVSRL